ncbi:hypothetical protein QBC41DRAFT_353509 [Cercophora samala]|uniref:Uncharacterized protein n=1 Tax=Cercophora samala TaxID=330535 RepID=A0AA39ZK88_9PEZI|nr:hypothetical protein QBC41DRAFT_353509 [Cercophora samala]
MGIFSFLSRKSHDKHKAASLKAHAYDTIAAGTVPVQGAYPVSGNGPNVFDTLSRGRPDFRHTQLSLMVPNNDNGAAPAPGVPRYRDPSVERPNTAPNGQQPTLQHMSSGTRLRKAGKKPPPVSFKMLRSTGSTINGGSRPASQGSEFETKSVSRGPANHSRSNSMRSESGRFKDILDAHSELKAPDFRARVKAAGAKDYGEDVAERNMGQNGFDLESEHVKAFYDSHPNAPRSRKSTATLNPRSSRHTIRETPSSQPQPKWPIAPPPPSIAPSQRSLPKALAGQIPRYKSTETALYADVKTTGGGHLKRRVSVNTYMPPTSFNNPSTVSLSKVHGSEINTIDLDILKPPIVMGAPRTSRESPRTARIPRDSVMLARRKVSIPDHLAAAGGRDSSPERTFSLRSATTQPQHRASMSSSSASASFLVPRKRHSLHTLHHHSSVYSSFAQGRDASIQGAQLLAYPRPHTASCLFQPPTPTPASGVDTNSVDGVEMSPSRKTPFTTPKMSSENLDASAAAAAAAVIRPLSRGGTLPLAAAAAAATPPLHPHPRHLATAAIPFEIPEHHVPIRTRSLRGYSASSGTPTTHTTAAESSSSSSSSNSPGRPQSRQTTTTVTSVSYCSLAPCSPTTGLSSGKQLGVVGEGEGKGEVDDDGFNMDDYISSDGDSMFGGGGGGDGVKKPNGEGEEELLWKEGGYGGGGLQLPGLWEVFPDCGDKRGEEEEEEEEKGLKTSWSYNGIGDSFGPRGGRRWRRGGYVIDTGVGSSEEEEEEEEGEGGFYGVEEEDEEVVARGRQMAIGRARGRKVKRRRRLRGIGGEEEEEKGSDADDEDGTPRGSRYRSGSRGRASVASYYRELREKIGVIEEERKVDVAAAVRLRKQVKSAQRAAGGGVRLRKGREGGGEGTANVGVRRGRSVPVLCVEGEEYRE